MQLFHCPASVPHLGSSRTHISNTTSHRLSIVFKVELNHFNFNRKISLKVSEKSKSILINDIDSPLSIFCLMIPLSICTLFNEIQQKNKIKRKFANQLLSIGVCVCVCERPWAFRDNNRSQWKYYLYSVYEWQLIKFNDSKLICCRLCFIIILWILFEILWLFNQFMRELQLWDFAFSRNHRMTHATGSSLAQWTLVSASQIRNTSTHPHDMAEAIWSHSRPRGDNVIWFWSI